DHPDSDEAHLALAKVLISARPPRFPEAEQELRQALLFNATLVDGHFLLGGIQLVNKEYAAAERSYLRTIELRPTHGLAHYNLGRCRLQQGNKAGAIDAFR